MAKAFDWARDERILDRRFVLPTSQGHYSQPAVTPRRFFTVPMSCSRRPLALLSSHDTANVISPRSALKRSTRYATDANASNIRYTYGGWCDKGSMRGTSYMGAQGLERQGIQGLGGQGLSAPQRSSSPSRFIPVQAAGAVQDPGILPTHLSSCLKAIRYSRPSSQEPRLVGAASDHGISERVPSEYGPSRKGVWSARADTPRGDTPREGDRSPAFTPSPHYRSTNHPRSMDLSTTNSEGRLRSLNTSFYPSSTLSSQPPSGYKTSESFGESTNDIPFRLELQHYVKVKGCSQGRLDLLLAKLHYYGFFVLDIQINDCRVYVRVQGGPTEKQRLLDMKYLYIGHEFGRHRNKLTLSNPCAASPIPQCAVLLPNQLQLPARKTLSMLGLILATVIKKFFSMLFSEPL